MYMVVFKQSKPIYDQIIPSPPHYGEVQSTSARQTDRNVKVQQRDNKNKYIINIIQSKNTKQITLHYTFIYQ